jgi:hypothetical protein
MALELFNVSDSHISGTAAIATRKMLHRYRVDYSQATGTAVVTLASYALCICKGTGTVRSFEAAIIGAIATGADRTVTIDLHKSTGAGAFATILSATVVFTNVSTIRVVSTATISDTALADGDMLYLTVTVAGAAGAQAQGLVCMLEYDEAA